MDQLEPEPVPVYANLVKRPPRCFSLRDPFLQPDFNSFEVVSDVQEEFLPDPFHKFGASSLNVDGFAEQRGGGLRGC